jgi:hypothetical protein
VPHDPPNTPGVERFYPVVGLILFLVGTALGWWISMNLAFGCNPDYSNYSEWCEALDRTGLGNPLGVAALATPPLTLCCAIFAVRRSSGAALWWAAAVDTPVVAAWIAHLIWG